jgi:type VI secretion system protein
MPRELSLLDRIRHPELEASRTIHQNTGRLAESVLANLRRLLNSRQGIAPIQADYGIPDLCDVAHNFPEAIGGMRKAIKAAVEKYEPRLRRVNVKHVEAPDDIFALRFEITAELITEGERASVWIETRIDSSGEVELKG